MEAEQRADVDLQQRARGELGPEQFVPAGEEAFGALGVGDEEAEAGFADVPAGGQPLRVDAGERDLEQDPARAPRAVRDQVEVVRRERGRAERMDLAAGMQEQLDARGGDRGLQRSRALGDRRDVERVVGMADVRRDGGLVDAFAGEALRVDEARGLVGRTIVDPGQQVKMEINVGHLGLSGGSSVSAHRIVCSSPP